MTQIQAILNELEPNISMLVLMARISYPTAQMQEIIDKVEPKVDLVFPPGWPTEKQEELRSEIRKLIVAGFKGK